MTNTLESLEQAVLKHKDGLRHRHEQFLLLVVREAMEIQRNASPVAGHQRAEPSPEGSGSAAGAACEQISKMLEDYYWEVRDYWHDRNSPPDGAKLEKSRTVLRMKILGLFSWAEWATEHAIPALRQHATRYGTQGPPNPAQAALDKMPEKLA